MNKANSPSFDDDTAKILTPSKYVVSRMVGDLALILDPTQDEIRQLNEVGTFIWSMILKSQYTRDEVLHALIQTFDISSDVASSDLEEFPNDLDSISLIQLG